MRSIVFAAATALACCFASAHAQDMAGVCHASSSYDLTVRPDALQFDRPQPAPTQVLLHDGSLRTDGAAVSLRPDEQDRLSLFERDLRTLVPRVRSVAQNGVDMAVAAMQAESRSMGLSADTQAQLQSTLKTRAAQLKQRIAASTSTRDWQGDLANQYANQLAGEIVPLVASDLGQQAVAAAMSGDMQAASDLRDRAADLSTRLRPRLEQRMQALRPQIQALCPAIAQLAELQQGIRAADGQPLDLITVSR